MLYFLLGLTNRSQPVNMVFINWSKLAGAPWYEFAANNVKPVGEYAARLLNFLTEQDLLEQENFYFVGHSLGAHMANYVSSNMLNGKLNHIFGIAKLVNRYSSNLFQLCITCYICTLSQLWTLPSLCLVRRMTVKGLTQQTQIS